MIDRTTINKITKWGNSQPRRNGYAAITDYNNKFFGKEFTDSLRDQLCHLARNREPGLTGSWRKGYGLHQPDGSVIGVGTYRKGYNGFAVFYIPGKVVVKVDADIPFNGEPGDGIDDDYYGLQPEN